MPLVLLLLGQGKLCSLNRKNELGYPIIKTIIIKVIDALSKLDAIFISKDKVQVTIE